METPPYKESEIVWWWYASLVNLSWAPILNTEPTYWPGVMAKLLWKSGNLACILENCKPLIVAGPLTYSVAWLSAAKVLCLSVQANWKEWDQASAKNQEGHMATFESFRTVSDHVEVCDAAPEFKSLSNNGLFEVGPRNYELTAMVNWKTRSQTAFLRHFVLDEVPTAQQLRPTLLIQDHYPNP